MKTLIRSLAAYGYLVSLTIDSIVVFPGIGSASRLVGVAVIVVAIAKMRSTKSLPSLRLAPVAFLVYALTSASWSSEYSFVPAIQLTLAIGAAYALGYLLIDLDQWRRRAAWAFVGGCVADSLMTIASAFSPAGIDPLAGRAVAGEFDANELAVILSIGACFALWLGLTSQSSTIGISAFAMLLPILGALLLTGSRGGLLSATSGILTVLLTPRVASATDFRKSDGLRNRIIGIGALAGGCWLAFSIAPESVLQRFDLSTGDSVGTFEIRQVLWKVAYSDFLQSPTFGHGLGSAEQRLAAAGFIQAVYHSAFFEVLAELGVVGSLLLAWAVWQGLFGAALMGRWLVLPSTAIVAALLIGGVGLSITYEKITWAVLVLASVYRSADDRAATESRADRGSLVSGIRS